MKNKSKEEDWKCGRMEEWGDGMMDEWNIGIIGKPNIPTFLRCVYVLNIQEQT